MSLLDILLLVLLAAAVGLALRSIRAARRKGKGCLGCGGQCAGCAAPCSKREETQNKP